MATRGLLTSGRGFPFQRADSPTARRSTSGCVVGRSGEEGPCCRTDELRLRRGPILHGDLADLSTRTAHDQGRSGDPDDSVREGREPLCPPVVRHGRGPRCLHQCRSSPNRAGHSHQRPGLGSRGRVAGRCSGSRCQGRRIDPGADLGLRVPRDARGVSMPRTRRSPEPDPHRRP